MALALVMRDLVQKKVGLEAVVDFQATARLAVVLEAAVVDLGSFVIR